MEKRSNDVEKEVRDNPSPDGSASTDVEISQDREVKPEPADVTESETQKLQAQIAAKDKELSEIKDRYLRALADNENARKRIRQQSEESIRIQRENFLRDLLPIVDNLERAVEAARGGGNGKPIVEGVEMVLRTILDFLKTHGVTQISAVGELFDPQRHEAVDQIESDQHPPNTVVNEFHRGYQIGERLLRPARVAVAKSGPERDGGGEGNGNGSGEVETG
jgi:molecular chaperone GrpE